MASASRKHRGEYRPRVEGAEASRGESRHDPRRQIPRRARARIVTPSEPHLARRTDSSAASCELHARELICRSRVFGRDRASPTDDGAWVKMPLRRRRRRRIWVAARARHKPRLRPGYPGCYRMVASILLKFGSILARRADPAPAQERLIRIPMACLLSRLASSPELPVFGVLGECASAT